MIVLYTRRWVENVPDMKRCFNHPLLSRRQAKMEAGVWQTGACSMCMPPAARDRSGPCAMDNALRLPPQGCCAPAGYGVGYRVQLCSTHVGLIPSANSKVSRIASAIGAAVVASFLRAGRASGSEFGRATARMAMAHAELLVDALLISDKDFVNTILEVQATGTRVVALVPSSRFSVIGRYQAERIEVHKINISSETTGPRVRAELHSDGNGSVHFSDPYCTLDNKGGKAVLSVLDQLGYREGEGLALPAIAKFWYCNLLGSLTVFPGQLATIAMQDVIDGDRTRKWEPYSRNLAFVLPQSASSRKSEARIQKYGNLHARSIYQGGGPFILEDSPDLVPVVLRKLGFLDNG